MLNQNLRRDRAWIAAHIPHQGAMCLLDSVLDWNDVQVRCMCRSHRSAENPLRARGRLGAACGIEIAAQAIAVHGALLASTQQAGARPGYLAGVRNVALHVSRLDDIYEDLIATASRFGGDDTTVIYDFELSAGTPDVSMRPLVTGRAMIVLGAGSLS